MKKEKTKLNWKNIKKKWWLVAIVIVFAIYLINGTVFAFFIYKQYPNNLEEGKLYPDQESTIVRMSAIYPYPAAWVNYRPIWIKDYYKQIGFVRHFSKETNQEISSNSELERQVIDQMIDAELMRQQARKYNIRVTKQEVDDAFNQLAEENQGEEQVNDILSKLYGMTQKDFKELIADQLLRQKMQDELFIQVRARHIVIADEEKAKEVLEKVKNEEKSFEDLAKEYSEDTASRDNGGDLDWFGRGMMVKEFEDAVFDLEPGQLKDDLTKSDFGYHIIKLEEKSGKLDQSYFQWYEEIRSNSKISIWIKTDASDGQDELNIIYPEENDTEENKDEQSEDKNE
jgi:foldase protein PrsA